MAFGAGKVKLNIGILGKATIALDKVLPALRKLPDLYDVIAIGSRNPKSQNKSMGCKICTYDEILLDPEIDLIYIPLPNSLHVDWIIKSLESGKHVLCEKPFCLNSKQLDAILKLSIRHSLLIRENFQFTHHAQSQLIRETLKEKALGDVNLIRVDFAFPPFKEKNNIRYDKNLDGGAARDAGAYTIKFLLEFFNLDWQKSTANFIQNTKDGVDYSGCFQLLSAEGVMAQTFFSFKQDYICRFEILGSKGRLSGSRIFTAPPDYNEPLIYSSNNKSLELTYKASDQFLLQFVDLHRTILNGSFNKDREDITRQTQLLEMCLRD